VCSFMSLKVFGSLYEKVPRSLSIFSAPIASRIHPCLVCPLYPCILSKASHIK